MEMEEITEQSVPENQDKPSEVEASPEPASTESDELHVPKKLLGKSSEEIIKSYVELEKLLGKQGKELEDYRSKKVSEESAPAISRPVVEARSQPESTGADLDKLYDELWDRNPKEAPKIYAQLIRERDRQQELLNQTTQIAHAAANGQLSGFEDFNEVRPTMINVANELLPYVNPSEVNHPKVFQALYLIAKALHLPSKMKKMETEAIEKAKKKVIEKQAVFSEESSSSSGSETVPFSAEHMSFDQMKKVLGIVD